MVRFNRWFEYHRQIAYTCMIHTVGCFWFLAFMVVFDNAATNYLCFVGMVVSCVCSCIDVIKYFRDFRGN